MDDERCEGPAHRQSKASRERLDSEEKRESDKREAGELFGALAQRLVQTNAWAPIRITASQSERWSRPIVKPIASSSRLIESPSASRTRP
jgi:hypothetical protein